MKSYITLVKPKTRKLIEEQVKTLNAVKVQMHLWIMWKKKEEEKQAWQGSKTHETLVDKPFNSRMTEVFQGSNVEEILQGMFAHIKTQIEHPVLPKSGFTLDQIMYLDIDFHQLELTQGGSYIELLHWIASKKAVINPKTMMKSALNGPS